jgi:CHAT domain-containing protein/Tfp pilus assembly protein PilF
VSPASFDDNPAELIAEGHHPGVSEALELSRSWRAEDKRKAIELFRVLLDLSLERRDHSLEQLSSNRLGDLHRSLGLNEEAVEFYRRALRTESDLATIDARIGLSRALIDLEEFVAARAEAHRALAASQKLGDRQREAAALVTLGIADYDSRELARAVSRLEESIPLLNRLGEDELLAQALLYLGFAHSELSREWKAKEELEEAVRVSRRSGARGLEAQALVSLGHVLSKVGERQKALDIYYQAAPLVREAGNPYAELSLYAGMGYLHSELGDPGSAEEFHQRALQISKKVGSSVAQAGIRIHLGRLQAARGDYAKAISNLFAARALLEDVEDRAMRAEVLGEIAEVQVETGKKEKALTSFEQALSIAREKGFERVEADLFNGLGALELDMGRTVRAREHLDRALLLSRRTSSPIAESRALIRLAQLERNEGQLEKALAKADEALERVETLRGNIGSRRLRVSYMASVYELHSLHVELLMELERKHPGSGWLDRGFLAAERARARSLLETLAQTDDDGFAASDPALLDYQARLEEAIRSQASDPQDRCPEARSSGLASSDSLTSLLAELDRVKAVVRSEQPAEPVKSPEPVGLPEVQRELLDDRTALLAYFLGSRESYLWAVTPSNISVHYLPSRERIESEARELYTLLAGRGRKAGETEAQRYERLKRSDAEYWKVASELSESLLEPALENLDADRLVIVGDGTLNRIPFSALPRPGGEAEPMITRYELVRLPSAAIWKALTERRAARAASAKKLAVLADPVLDSHDPRLSSRSTEHRAEDERFFTARGVPREVARMPRLLSSREEARRVLELVPENERFEALGFDANLGLARSGALAEYEVVHFATHGLLSSDQPELSGIALSLFDRDGNPQKGFLRLHDIYDLKLPVRLVVLSACSTALGREVRGEGLVGLVGGFLSSGTQGVIASYWDVDDAATAELMSRFYRHLFVDRESPSKSLQMAQSSMWRERRWLSPELWGAFEFQGLGE